MSVRVPYTGPITLDVARKVLDVVDQGLCLGLGTGVPGSVCVEAAVAYALGEPHTDHPACVNGDLRSFKIQINDGFPFQNDAERAKVLRRIAIAQLGTRSTPSVTATFDWNRFEQDVLAWAEKQWPQLDEPSIIRRVYAEFEQGKHQTAYAFYDACSAPKRANFISAFTVLVYVKRFPEHRDAFVEACVQALVAQETPGSKFLYLTETPA
jgi:hypothetical protein